MTPVRGQLLDNLRKKSREVWRPLQALVRKGEFSIAFAKLNCQMSAVLLVRLNVNILSDMLL